jgi:NADH:ubiquinone oxidoreductase subunit
MSVFSELFSWWNGQTLGMRLFTAQRGVAVGEDGEGNRYFEERSLGPLGRKRRWVLYNGLAESSRVPPEWHGWLHHTVDAPPTAAPAVVKPWEKPHRPNLSGTTGAYHPPGSLFRPPDKGPRVKAYEPWIPE